jgi:hypothetical protein
MSATSHLFRYSLICGLLLSHALLLIWSALIHSPNANEVAHLVAGVSHWERGRFELYRVNPPLVRMIAAIPAVVMGCEADWSEYGDYPRGRYEFALVPRFVQLNGEWTCRYVILGRLACIPFSLIGAWACHQWAGRMYGRSAALVSLCLWCFSPSILAHGAFMTPDGPAASLGVVAAYTFWLWCRQPKWTRSMIAGCALGLALLTKLTWVLLFILWPLIALHFVLRSDRFASRRGSRTMLALQFGLICLTAVHIVNTAYLYDGTFSRLDSYRFVSKGLAGASNQGARAWGNIFAGSAIGSLRVPLPRQYILGFDVQQADFEIPKRTYFLGKWYSHRVWYYYLYGLLVKTPIGAFLAAGLAILSLKVFSHRLGDTFLALHFLLVLAVVSAASPWNAHLRYAMPSVPFSIIWMSRSAILGRQNRVAHILVVVALMWTATSSLLCVPHSLSYFNEIAGGPSAGHRHFVDSNIDWGQDLYLLKQWIDDHPDVEKIGLAYYGQLNPRAVGIEFFLPVDDASARRKPGWYAVSVSMMHGLDFWQTTPEGEQFWCKPDGYADFLNREPVCRVAYTFYIFHIKGEENGAPAP